MKTTVQLDFDGTVTEEDISFLLLDAFADGDWRKYLKQYSDRKITVAAFSKKVFSMIKADEKTLTDFVLKSPQAKARPGLREFTDYCKNKGIKVVIVSNGLEFYIKLILRKLGIKGLDIYAAENVFSPAGMKVRYIGPDGKEINDRFKEAYTDIFRLQGYRVVYIGDGLSDIYSARKVDYVCATRDLLELCKAEKLKCYPFSDFFDVVKILKSLKLG